MQGFGDAFGEVLAECQKLLAKLEMEPCPARKLDGLDELRAVLERRFKELSHRFPSKGGPSSVQLSELRDRGLSGFVPVVELFRTRCREMPEVPGVYAVIRDEEDPPRFLERGTAAAYKGKDPNVPIELLRARWVPGARVLYIGKASTSLRRRVRALVRFGLGHKASHWGGRMLWQVEGASRFLVAWKVTAVDARQAERHMLHQFEVRYGSLPFANQNR